MKNSEIKNLLRYCIGKVQEAYPNMPIECKGYNVEWDGERWTTDGSGVCPLATILLVRQPKPSEKNIEENFYNNGNGIYRHFPETFAAEEVKAILEVSTEWLYDFYNAIENRLEQKTPGWEIGNYIYKRLHGNVE